MPDPRFFRSAGPFRAEDVARRAVAELAPGIDPGSLITDLATLEEAGPGDLIFASDRSYLARLKDSAAGFCLLRPADQAHAPSGMALLLTPQPQRAFALAAALFYPAPRPNGRIHPTAQVDATAKILPDTEIGAFSVVGPGAEIGRGCLIGEHVVIGAGVTLGEDCRIGAHVSLSHAHIGDRVTLHPGVRVGQDGFGFVMDRPPFLKVPQLGRVIIQDDCDIGANSTVDRGALGDTVIGQGCWIDNMVQIGHNSQVGRCCVLVAQSGLSGSTVLNDFVAVGGQAGIANHAVIGTGAQVGAQSGVMQDVAPGARVFGTPAVPIRQYFRERILLGKMATERASSAPGSRKEGSEG